MISSVRRTPGPETRSVRTGRPAGGPAGPRNHNDRTPHEGSLHRRIDDGLVPPSTTMSGNVSPRVGSAVAVIGLLGAEKLARRDGTRSDGAAVDRSGAQLPVFGRATR